MIRVKVRLVETQEFVYIFVPAEASQLEEVSHAVRLPGRFELTIPEVATREMFKRGEEYYFDVHPVKDAPPVPEGKLLSTKADPERPVQGQTLSPASQSKSQTAAEKAAEDRRDKEADKRHDKEAGSTTTTVHTETEGSHHDLPHRDVQDARKK